ERRWRDVSLVQREGVCKLQAVSAAAANRAAGADKDAASGYLLLRLRTDRVRRRLRALRRRGRQRVLRPGLRDAVLRYPVCGLRGRSGVIVVMHVPYGGEVDIQPIGAHDCRLRVQYGENVVELVIPDDLLRQLVAKASRHLDGQTAEWQLAMLE